MIVSSSADTTCSAVQALVVRPAAPTEVLALAVPVTALACATVLVSLRLRGSLMRQGGRAVERKRACSPLRSLADGFDFVKLLQAVYAAAS